MLREDMDIKNLMIVVRHYFLFNSRNHMYCFTYVNRKGPSLFTLAWPGMSTSRFAAENGNTVGIAL
jgi:hypothetical protein